MSFKVTLAFEDHTLDQYIGRPVMQALLADLGKPNAIVRPVMNPRIRGIEQLKNQACEILDSYSPISDFVVFMIDCDGEDGSHGRGDRLATFRNLIANCPKGENALVVVARQELEVWALWGSRSDLGVPWSEVIKERDPKERFFEPLITAADQKFPGRGRERLVTLSLRSGWRSLRSGCPELAQLQDELQARLS